LHTQLAEQAIILNQYERLKRIGTGQHGEVHAAWDMDNKCLVVRTVRSLRRRLALIDLHIPYRPSKE
jgi:hypothetical protein